MGRGCACLSWYLPPPARQARRSSLRCRGHPKAWAPPTRQSLPDPGCLQVRPTLAVGRDALGSPPSPSSGDDEVLTHRAPPSALPPPRHAEGVGQRTAHSPAPSRTRPHPRHRTPPPVRLPSPPGRLLPPFHARGWRAASARRPRPGPRGPPVCAETCVKPLSQLGILTLCTQRARLGFYGVTPSVADVP